MIETILTLLSFYALTYLVKEADILSRPRNWLMMRSVFLTKVLYCFFCTSIWTSAIIYFIHEKSFDPFQFIIWILGGATIAHFMNAIFNKLTWEKTE